MLSLRPDPVVGFANAGATARMGSNQMHHPAFNGPMRPTSANLRLQRALLTLREEADQDGSEDVRAAPKRSGAHGAGHPHKRVCPQGKKVLRKRRHDSGLLIVDARRVIDEFFDVLTWSVVREEGERRDAKPPVQPALRFGVSETNCSFIERQSRFG